MTAVNEYTEKLNRFAEVLRSETKASLEARHLNLNGCNEPRTRVIQGKTFAKIDLGNPGQWSGKYMVTPDGLIFGIKAYGVIHKGHQYGTLDTIDDWSWGDYTAVKKLK